jgi:hypothetical protein
MKSSFSMHPVALLSTLAVSVTLAASGCFGGNCDCSPGGVMVVFQGFAPSDVSSVTATGSACGPVPKPLCDTNENVCETQKCDSSGHCVTKETTDWTIDIPAKAEGSCKVHVVLKDGEVFDDTVQVTQSTDGCCQGFAGSKSITVAPKK